MWKHLFATHFLLATSNVCPLAIPEFFTHNRGIRLLANHSLRCKWKFQFTESMYSYHLPYLISVPSQAPSNFTVTAITSTSIKASWQLPPKYARHGTITGFKLFYAKKASQGSPNVLTNNVTSLSRVVSGLDKYTEYEFQVLAFSSKGDGPKSSVVVERTKEDGKLILVKDSTCIIIFCKKLKRHFSGQQHYFHNYTVVLPHMYCCNSYCYFHNYVHSYMGFMKARLIAGLKGVLFDCTPS